MKHDEVQETLREGEKRLRPGFGEGGLSLVFIRVDMFSVICDKQIMQSPIN